MKEDAEADSNATSGPNAIMSAIANRQHRWTRQQYEQMVSVGILAEDDKLELVDGYILDMTPQSSLHANAVAIANRELGRCFGEGYLVRPQLPLAIGDSSEPEPDLAVVRGSGWEHRDAHPTETVLLVEVAQSSLAFDRGLKRTIYAEAGVPEYWIVNLDQGVLEVYREPSPEGFGDQRILRRGDTIQPLAAAGASIAVADLLPPAGSGTAN